MPNYQNTIIYIIKCKDENITEEYVGHTTNIKLRIKNHKNICNNENHNYYNLKIYKIIRENGGWINWKVIEFEKYPCNNKTEALNKEEEIRQLRNSKLNSNKAFLNDENKKEYNKQRYEENKEEILEQRKKYHENNREIILEKHKIYYQNNKDKHLEKCKEWVKNNKEKSNQYKLNYIYKNKDKISEKASEKYKCICGSCIRKDSKYKHERSPKHIKLVSLGIP